MKYILFFAILDCISITICDVEIQKDNNVLSLGKLFTNGLNFSPKTYSSVQSFKRTSGNIVFLWPGKLINNYHKISQLNVLMCNVKDNKIYAMIFPNDFDTYTIQELNDKLFLVSIWNKQDEYARVDIYALDQVLNAESGTELTMNAIRSIKIDLTPYVRDKLGGKDSFSVIDVLIKPDNPEKLLWVAKYLKLYFNPLKYYLGGGHQDAAIKICIGEYPGGPIKYISEENRNSYALQMPAKIDRKGNTFYVIQQEDSNGYWSEFIMLHNIEGKYEHISLPFLSSKFNHYDIQGLDMIFAENDALFYLWEERLLRPENTGIFYRDGYYAIKINNSWSSPIPFIAAKTAYLLRSMNNSIILLGWSELDGIHLQTMDGKKILYSYIKKINLKPKFRLLWRAEIDNHGKYIYLLWAESAAPQTLDNWNTIGDAYFERIKIQD